MYRAGKESASLDIDSPLGEEFDPDGAFFKGFKAPAGGSVGWAAIKLRGSCAPTPAWPHLPVFATSNRHGPSCGLSQEPAAGGATGARRPVNVVH